MSALSLDPKDCALLVLDLQTALVDQFCADAGLLQRVGEVLALSRQAGIPIIYTVVGFRSAYPGVLPCNSLLEADEDLRRFLAPGGGSEIHPAVAPQAGDLVITKHRESAFAFTDLPHILQSNGRQSLVLLGSATTGAVLSSVRQGYDGDFNMVVLADCCYDPDTEGHWLVLDRIVARQAAVIDAVDFLEALEAVIQG